MACVSALTHNVYKAVRDKSLAGYAPCVDPRVGDSNDAPRAGQIHKSTVDGYESVGVVCVMVSDDGCDVVGVRCVLASYSPSHP